ncbi:MAG: sigma-70 family RNA polymerase sigma factor [Muribaculum sp.]|nr:sigma-70 family RNA polymerase sigma factor [Muribaculum sp.]
MDTVSFKQLVLPHSDAMYRTAFYVTHDRDDALDSVQESVADLWEHRDALEGVADIRAYVMTTVKHHALDLLRRRPFAGESIEDAGAAIPDNSADTASRVEHSDTLAKVMDLTSSLSDNERRILLLRSQSDCSVDEIASVTGLKEDNVRQILSRARRKLKELYKKII